MAEEGYERANTTFSVIKKSTPCGYFLFIARLEINIFLCKNKAKGDYMVIILFGESCTGKSTISNRLKNVLKATCYTGKDYLRLAKSEAESRKLFI